MNKEEKLKKMLSNPPSLFNSALTRMKDYYIETYSKTKSREILEAEFEKKEYVFPRKMFFEIKFRKSDSPHQPGYEFDTSIMDENYAKNQFQYNKNSNPNGNFIFKNLKDIEIDFSEQIEAGKNNKSNIAYIELPDKGKNYWKKFIKDERNMIIGGLTLLGTLILILLTIPLVIAI